MGLWLFIIQTIKSVKNDLMLWKSTEKQWWITGWNPKYVNKGDDGESGYLYEWYPRWYAQYEETLCGSITKWYYDSEEGSPDVEYGDYVYAMNHLPGMTYSLLYIYKILRV